MVLKLIYSCANIDIHITLTAYSIYVHMYVDVGHELSTQFVLLKYLENDISTEIYKSFINLIFIPLVSKC